MAIKFNNLIVGDKVVDSIESTTSRPEPTVVRVAPVQQETTEHETEKASDRKKSQYMMDMSKPIPPSYFDEE